MKYLLAFLMITLLALSCSDDNGIKNTTWQLVWEDNFDGEQGQLPNPENWTYDVGTDWGNAQLEYDTDRADNVQLDGQGNLAIIARRENFAGSSFTSGRIKTQGLFDQAYGRFEARILMPYGPGIWPAFWLLGSDIDEVNWPQCGEIDIMEYRGQEPNIIHGSVHGPGYSGGNAITKSYGLQKARFDTDFYIYAIEWGGDYIDFFVNDDLYQRITPEDVTGEWVYDHPFFIILNVAVGGNYVGFPTDQTVFPQTMLVDYVRVYSAVE
ncbi:glycoside hydrolase family 16 protein [Portibacter marinus]|uniref:glycoside hydrolase family 16 protein n=1 Tax=Portibacter marinus TaxID=2898660 RepID=UPI001F43BC6A|nr:glycoside hydrolase family 16 protein [Portibacter marinus]